MHVRLSYLPENMPVHISHLHFTLTMVFFRVFVLRFNWLIKGKVLNMPGMFDWINLLKTYNACPTVFSSREHVRHYRLSHQPENMPGMPNYFILIRTRLAYSVSDSPSSSKTYITTLTWFLTKSRSKFHMKILKRTEKVFPSKHLLFSSRNFGKLIIVANKVH